jgi:hypothetical protein
VILGYAWQFPDGKFNSVLGVAVTVSGASLALGGLLGFLFGIPRTRQGNTSTTQATDIVGPQVLNGGDTSPNPIAATSQTRFFPNTNLEDISDWLTKILVGVGLIQIGQLPELMRSLANYLAPGFGDANSTGGAIAVGLVLYFLVVGFLEGYVWARVYFTRILQLADADVAQRLANRIEQVEQQTTKVEKRTLEVEERATSAEQIANEVKDQAAKNAEALAMVFAQLNPTSGTQALISSETFRKAIAEIAPATRSLIFNQAEAHRRINWRDPATKEIMARAIPIFRALIENDPNEEHHEYRGSLGFVLKDQANPGVEDLKEAERLINDAIRIRGDLGSSSWPIYEFNRAHCRILLDPAFQNKRPSDSRTQAMIMEDLDKANNEPRTKGIVQGDPDIKTWLSYNNLNLQP